MTVTDPQAIDNAAQEVARPDLRRRPSRRRSRAPSSCCVLTEWPEYVALDPAALGAGRRETRHPRRPQLPRPGGLARPPAGPTAPSAAHRLTAPG